MKNCLSLLLCVYCWFCLVIDGQSQTSDVSNSKVERVIDLTSQLVRITTRIIVDNSANKKPLDSYLVTFDDNHRNSLAFLSATIDKKALQLTKVDNKFWRLELSGSNAIGAGVVAAAQTIEIVAVFSHLLTPFPSHIVQSERQLVLYSGNTYFASPYVTKSQTTKVILPLTGSVESYTKLKPTAQDGHTINYGPYDNIAANSYSELKIHNENNSPFLTVTKLERNIELSHWAGMISIEEIIDVRHDGAQLRGPFSRYEYQREPSNGISSVKSWKTKLPSSSRDIYYRDEIGNISTSTVKSTVSNLVVDLRPRFPLFGGWKTHYVLGYYMPTNNFLFNDGNEFALKIPFVDHIFDNSVVDEAVVRVVLPEGASDVKLRLPYSAVRDRDDVQYSYLDTVGRTVVVLRKSNLVEQHIQDFEVQYTFNKIMMLREPLLVISVLFALCILVIIYVRLDFTISPFQKQTDSKSVKPSASKASDVTQPSRDSAQLRKAKKSALK